MQKGSGNADWQLAHYKSACPGNQESKLQPRVCYKNKHSTTSQVKEGIIRMCSVLVWPHVEHCVQFCAPQFTNDGKGSRSGQQN